ncbi:lipase family alpha/beta hydrolase [Hoyosella altamirensis]|uniref:Triacylglycerol esterase/lipase EstA (Alpha/beta hydrolase family) n=1 Tax=Hoyosella altamirensis TaxID=616997 RepID=A0A839RU72_9ACTN|nr:alpha/beta fold hydrolase [Hoyosella altamirensis]MBB3039909.1 triacylglycerol esterase/lipase EstA (alpha/beta hydrolase family) [Hoyosella altamirensis]
MLVALPVGAEVRHPVMPEAQGPRQTSAPDAKQFDKKNPGYVPAGSNEFDCSPTETLPYPVLLAHGTDASAYADYARLGPVLRDHGYCVFALNYGLGKPGVNFSPATGLDADTYGTTDMRQSAQEVAEAVTRIRTATGAEKVHLIGFSQGANVTRYYVNKLDGAAHVDAWVGIASPSYGTDAPPAVAMVPGGETLADDYFAPALVQQIAGSEFLNDLNSPADTVEGVRYTTIGTRHDEVIQPLRNTHLKGAGARNVFIQDSCEIDMSGHFQLPYSPLVSELVLEALEPGYQRSDVCTFVPPGVGLLETIIVNNF